MPSSLLSFRHRSGLDVKLLRREEENFPAWEGELGGGLKWGFSIYSTFFERKMKEEEGDRQNSLLTNLRLNKDQG